MKRLAVALACALAAAPALAGCGSSGSSGDDDTITIGVSFYSKVIPLYVDMREGMEAQAKQRDVKLEFSYANSDAHTQVNQIQTFVNKDVDLIVVSPFDEAAVVPGYKAAREAGIPIFSVANKVADDEEDLFIGRDWSQFGYEMVKAVAKATGGTGKVGLVSGPPAIAVVRAVSAGWQKGFDENPGLEPMEALVDPDMSTTKALDLANTMFSSHPDLVAVVTTIDQIGLGVVQAATEQGIDHKKVFIASMDADPQSVTQVRDGTGIDFTVSQRGNTWGKQVVNVAADWLDGKKPDGHVVENESTVVISDNVAGLKPEDLK